MTRTASKLIASQNRQPRVRFKNQVVSIFAAISAKHVAVVLENSGRAISIVSRLLSSQNDQSPVRPRYQVVSIFAAIYAGPVVAT